MMILACAIAQGLVTVASRMMQSVHWSVILFTYSLVGAIVFAITYFATTDDPVRILSYSAT